MTDDLLKRCTRSVDRKPTAILSEIRDMVISSLMEGPEGEEIAKRIVPSAYTIGKYLRRAKYTVKTVTVVPADRNKEAAIEVSVCTRVEQ